MNSTMAATLPLFEDDLDHVVLQTRDLWRDVPGKRFFLTGGTGFFGCWLAETLLHASRRLELDLSLTIVTRDPARFRRNSPHIADAAEVSVVAANMADLSPVTGCFDYAIHAATETFQDRHGQVEPLAMFERNVQGTREFLSVVQRSGVSRFLYVSSGAAYGPQPVGVAMLREDDPYAPNPLLASAANGESKRCSEFLCALHSRGAGNAPGAIARGFSFIGPHLPLDYTYAIGNFIRDSLAGQSIRIGGDGTPVRSYLYMADLSVWLWTLLFRGRGGEAYNVGSEHAVSILEAATAVRNALRPDAQIVVAQKPPISARPSRYVPSTEKARRELRLEQHISFTDAIQRTAAWNRGVQPLLAR